MKRLWISLAILAVILLGTTYHTLHLTHFTEELSGLLLHAEELAEIGHWEDAAHLSQMAEARWRSRSAYLHITLRHTDIDDINLSFSELREFIDHQELDQCAVSIARLDTQLALLAEMEQPTLKNIL